MRQMVQIRQIQSKNYRVLTAHSDTNLRAEMRFAFQSEGYEAIIAESAEDMLSHARMLLPHLLVADARMFEENFEQGISTIKSLRTNMLILLITMPTDVEVAFQAAKQNVDGVIVTPVDINQLVWRAGQKLVDKFGCGRKRERATIGLFALTPREQQVLDLVSRGFSNKEIGIELKISPRTAEVHRARGMEKLGARNTAELVRIFLNTQ